MPGRTPNQALADILTNIEEAREYLGNMTLDEFSGNREKQKAVLYSLQSASEAAYRLPRHWPDFANQFEARYPSVSWRQFRDLGNAYRHGYDDINLARVWEDLEPGGIIAQAEAAMRQEIAFSQIPPTKIATSAAKNPLDAPIFARSETFAQSMRYRVLDITPDSAPTFEGRILWLEKLPQSEGNLALVQVEGEAMCRRMHAVKADGVKIGDTVTVEPSERGFTLARKGLEQNQQLRPRMS